VTAYLAIQIAVTVLLVFAGWTVLREVNQACQADDQAKERHYSVHFDSFSDYEKEAR